MINKAEFINKLAAKGYTKAKSTQILDDFLNTIVESCVDNDGVKFVGFGTFQRKQRTARNGVNPKTGEKIEIAAKNSVVFKPGSTFKEAVANG